MTILRKNKKIRKFKCQHAVDLFHFYTPYNKATTSEQNKKRNKKSQRAVDQNKKETP